MVDGWSIFTFKATLPGYLRVETLQQRTVYYDHPLNLGGDACAE
jgi:hypothetical protein